MKTTTQDFQKKDNRHHIHPFTDPQDLVQKGVRVIEKAQGVWLTDSEGNNIIDAMSGLWCVNVGYGQPSLVKAATEQMADLAYYNTFFQTSHPKVIELGERIAQLTPDGLDHSFFASSGSEANDTNIKIALRYWKLLNQPKKRVIISRKNAYHGSTIAASYLGGMEGMHAQTLSFDNITHIEQPYWYGLGGDYSCEEFGVLIARQLEQAIDKIGEDSVAAFIAEPVQGAGGVVIAPHTYWPAIQRICDEREILLIADEVITGFGRTGETFGSQTYKIKPDIMTIAKGLSSGYVPIGASVIHHKVMQVLKDGGDFNHGYTYSGHPVACAVALANLDLLEGGIMDNAQKTTSPYLAQQWLELKNHRLVGESRLIGMMAAIELTPNPNHRRGFKVDKGKAGLICREICFKNNVVMRHVGDTMVIAPPLTITFEEIDLMMGRIIQSLDETHHKLNNLGWLES